MDKHENDCDDVAFDISHEMEPEWDSISVRVREGIYEYVKNELLAYPYKDLGWKYAKGRELAKVYMSEGVSER